MFCGSKLKEMNSCFAYNQDSRATSHRAVPERHIRGMLLFRQTLSRTNLEPVPWGSV